MITLSSLCKWTPSSIANAGALRHSSPSAAGIGSKARSGTMFIRSLSRNLITVIVSKLHWELRNRARLALPFVYYYPYFFTFVITMICIIINISLVVIAVSIIIIIFVIIYCCCYCYCDYYNHYC